MSIIGFDTLSSHVADLEFAETASLREVKERRKQAVELTYHLDAPDFTIVLVETAMALTLDQLPASLQDREFLISRIKTFF